MKSQKLGSKEDRSSYQIVHEMIKLFSLTFTAHVSHRSNYWKSLLQYSSRKFKKKQNNILLYFLSINFGFCRLISIILVVYLFC